MTTFQVKNMSAVNAIVGLQISEFWYDKDGQPLQGTGDRQRLKTPLQPLDVATITLRSPKVPGMTNPQYKFEQNNGTVKPVKQKQIKAGAEHLAAHVMADGRWHSQRCHLPFAADSY